jgi:hypothetical protein
MSSWQTTCSMFSIFASVSKKAWLPIICVGNSICLYAIKWLEWLNPISLLHTIQWIHQTYLIRTFKQHEIHQTNSFLQACIQDLLNFKLELNYLFQVLILHMDQSKTNMVSKYKKNSILHIIGDDFKNINLYVYQIGLQKFKNSTSEMNIKLIICILCNRSFCIIGTSSIIICIISEYRF